MLTVSQKNAWTAALRSGDYKQIRKWGVGSKETCALGVLCDLLGKIREMETSTRILGPIAKDILRMNDCQHKSFSKIADWIDYWVRAETPKPVDPEPEPKPDPYEDDEEFIPESEETAFKNFITKLKLPKIAVTAETA